MLTPRSDKSLRSTSNLSNVLKSVIGTPLIFSIVKVWLPENSEKTFGTYSSLEFSKYSAVNRVFADSLFKSTSP